MSKRGKRNSEITGDEIKGSAKNIINPEQYYPLLRKSPGIASNYILKRNYAQFLSSEKDGCNLLNPSRAICHVRSCMKTQVLGGVNHLRRLITHWETHCMESKPVKFDKSCVVAVRRHHFLMKKDPDVWRDPAKLYTLEEMEGMADDAGDPLAIKELMKNKFIAQHNHEFRGSSFMLDRVRVQKIANCEESSSDEEDDDEFR